MTNSIAARVSGNLNLSLPQVENTLLLFAEGATVPFIARYRKEQTSGLDEVAIAAIEKEHLRLEELLKRKAFILKSLAEQGNLTEELKNSIERTWDANELEDIYLPFKPKRKTKASVAKEKGLEPLAAILMKQEVSDPDTVIRRFVKGEVSTFEEAVEGAGFIMAEWINERPRARATLRSFFARKATIKAKVIKTKEEEGSNFKDYFDFEELLYRIPSHRLLAIRRAENEGILRVAISPPEEDAITLLASQFVKKGRPAASYVEMAVKDAYKRLLKPALDTEFKNESKAKADDEAISVFAENLRQLLLTAPLGSKRILGIDPGFRSGCKTVCISENGELLHNENIYPHPPQNEKSKAAAKVAQLVEAYKIEAIAIGNGTAGRETEDFIKRMAYLPKSVEVYMVNEAGASIYSAGPVARKEFPNYDVTVRGAVSIGRRLMDPLAELVKIDPKSIGVGQYQHDVDQGKLKDALDRTVVSVVNLVGVELNTASAHLLAYVSGLGPKLAEQIVLHRNEHGAFRSREELLRVKGLGPKAYEQSAGFLRIANAANPLDNSAVHPESYSIVQKMAKSMGVDIGEMIANKEVLSRIKASEHRSSSAGITTINSIIDELRKAGRDPRGKAKTFSFDERLHKISDLREGMVVPGIVTNITNFGAFVDVGVKQDGLIHISEMADVFVSDPNTIVSLNQQLMVRVVSVEPERKRIAFSLKGM